MPRSVNHVASRARRKKILKLTRGYFGARKNLVKLAKLEEDFSSALEIILKHGVDDKLKEIIGFKEGDDYEN